MKVHPLSSGYPRMPDNEFLELKDSIRKKGKPNQPIVVLDGKVLDGIHRNECCEDLGITPPTIEYDGDKSPQAIALFLWEQNGLRRHLDASQRAMIGARLVTTGGRGRPELNPLNNGINQKQAAKTVGVSTSQIEDASKVLKQSPKEVVTAVEQGEVAVSDAAKVADLPKKEQKAALSKVKAGKAKTLKAAAEPHQRNGKQKNDPRLFDRIKTSIGAVRRSVDDLNRDSPAPKFHRECVASLNSATQNIEDWRRAIK